MSINEEDDIMEKRYELIREYFDWEHQIGSCNGITELSNLQILNAIESLKFLKNYLGSDFPLNAARQDHGICEFFWNKAPWTRVWFIWLADCFKKLETADGFDKVKAKFLSSKREDYNESISLLEFGYKFKKANFIVDFEQPVLNSSNREKRPDIRLTNQITKEVIYVEVSRLTGGNPLEGYHSVMHTITDNGFKHGKYLNFSGGLLKQLSKEHWQEIRDEIEEKSRWAAKEDAFTEVYKEGVIDLAIAPYKNRILEEWCSSKGYPLNAFSAPSTDWLVKAKNKLKHKPTQASADSPNILIIKNEDPNFSDHDAASIIASLEEYIYKWPNLTAAVIVGYSFGNWEKLVRSFGMDYHIRKTERYAWSSDSIIIFNKLNHTSKITLHSLSKIIDAFEKH